MRGGNRPASVPAALTGGADWATIERLVSSVSIMSWSNRLGWNGFAKHWRPGIRRQCGSGKPDPHDVLPAFQSDLEREQVEAALKAAKPLAGRRSFMADPSKAPKSSPTPPDESEITPG
ncbi:MAG: hypothetical protein R2845_03610 [Thermomicrobiales bacterium]